MCITDDGDVTTDATKGMIVEKGVTDKIFANITHMSDYAFDYQLMGGYVTIAGGYRVGISGDIVYDIDGKSRFGKVSSLCFRIAHNQMLFPDRSFAKLYDTNVYNTCVISPSGCGKTTFLKNFAMHIDKNRPDIHMCIADERGELAVERFKNASTMSNCNKAKAVEYFVRCMHPGLIIFDELWNDEDFHAVENAMKSGVSVIFSIHGYDSNSTVFSDMYQSLKLHIKRYVVLSKRHGPGTIENVECS